MNDALSSMLIRHEGLKLRAYFCPAGKITVGVGRNLEDRGITEEEALMLLENDTIAVRVEASRAFPWFARMNEARKDVVISMIFNMGMAKFLEFRLLIVALQKSDWEKAANEMLSSRWAAQVKGRAVELAGMMITGQYAP